ncbi:MAG: hypothetical protein HRT92_04075 [Piscirickettsiaceae bacterium]|nr:hypothetical protein [Piscirickettsiaceae bacterium]
MDDEKYIGYIKFDGELVNNGLMDGRKQAKALIGLDEALRYFISKQAPELSKLDYEIPIRIKKGSWEALIPETAASWTQAGLGVVVTAYFAKAAQKMAEKDFADFGIIDIFKKSIEAIKWFAKIGNHIGDLTIRNFENSKFSDDNMLIGLCNENGEYLYVPKYIFDMYITSNPKLLEKIAENITKDRNLKIGTIVDGDIDEVTIDETKKSIFCKEELEDEEDVLFPELVHGDTVVLEGESTRENMTSNSMGFKYQGHILTSHPETGSIVPYKSVLFLKCRLYGTVSRLDEKGRIAAKRPKLYFSHIEPLETESNGELF